MFAIALFSLLILAACSAPAPAAAPDAEPVAEEAAPTEAAPEEAAAAEEAAPTEVAAEEGADGEATVYTVDPAASSVAWFGSKPVGPTETGTVDIAEGQLTFNGSELVDGSFVIDMTTITTDSQSGNMKEMLEGHLKSDDFFGVETYPTATLVIKSVEPTDVENQYSVVGDLTIKETTAEIEFLTDVVVGDGTLEAVAEIVVDRAVFDVRYGSGSFFDNLGDDLISDEMEITVNLAAAS
jgi:polyisoprenoid-binding protein YceI